jgi:murein L,D-transpeptidase YafK
LKFRSAAWRALTASAVIAAAVALGGCDPEQIRLAKSMKPLSAQMMALIEQKNMAAGSQILVRLFKEEAELEIWKQDQSGRFEHLKTYPVCRWSGELGPKVKEGDRQAPEGFYTITQANLNPNSAYHLSINIGYPNEFDRAWNRSGSALMIHGDCSSRGCYAMTNEQIEEIYGLARDSFVGGQRAFQIQAYPFRMTALNMAKHRNSPHMAFWRMLKQGNDHFEVSHLQPTVNVCERRYIFDAQAPANASTALKFNAAAQCPAYAVDPDLLAAVNEKARNDDAEFAKLSKTTATVAVRTGRDGGMHPTFLAKVTRQIRNEDGTMRTVIDENAASMLGSYVNPPRDPGVPATDTNTYVASASPAAAPAPAATAIAASVPMPRPSPHTRHNAPVETANQTSTAMSLASADSKSVPVPDNPNPVSRAGSTMAKWIGLGGGDKTPAAAPPPRSPPVARPKPTPSTVAKHAPMSPTAAPSAVAAAAKKPPTASAPEARTSSAGNGLLNGATPVVSSDSFDSRFGPAR